MLLSDWPGATTGRVEMVEPIGAETLVWTRIQRKLFRAGGAGDQACAWRRDELVSLRIPQEHVHLFRRGSGRRLDCGNPGLLKQRTFRLATHCGYVPPHWTCNESTP